MLQKKMLFQFLVYENLIEHKDLQDVNIFLPMLNKY